LTESLTVSAKRQPDDQPTEQPIKQAPSTINETLDKLAAEIPTIEEPLNYKNDQPVVENDLHVDENELVTEILNADIEPVIDVAMDISSIKIEPVIDQIYKNPTPEPITKTANTYQESSKSFLELERKLLTPDRKFVKTKSESMAIKTPPKPEIETQSREIKKIDLIPIGSNKMMERALPLSFKDEELTERYERVFKTPAPEASINIEETEIIETWPKPEERYDESSNNNFIWPTNKETWPLDDDEDEYSDEYEEYDDEPYDEENEEYDDYEDYDEEEEKKGFGYRLRRRFGSIRR